MQFAHKPYLANWCLIFQLPPILSITNKQGDSIAETMWHNVSNGKSKTSTDLNKIEKGIPVHVSGRLRQTKYTDVHGKKSISHEILKQMSLVSLTMIKLTI